MVERHAPWVAALLLGAYWVMAVSAARVRSNTYDEIAQLTSGVSHWRTGDYRLNSEQGALPQRFAALPVAFGPFVLPPLEQEAWYRSDEFELGRQFFYESGNDPDAMLWRARAMNALFGVAAGCLTFVWSRRLWGAAGGLLSLALFVFCPALLAHGALATTDMAVTATLTASAVAGGAVLERVSWGRVAASSLALGLLALSKASAAIALPLFAVLLAVRLARGAPLPAPLVRTEPVRGRPAQCAVFGLVALIHAAVVVAMIWGAFGWRFTPFAEFEPGRDRLAERWEALDQVEGGASTVVRLCRRLHVLPEAYLWGLAHAHRHAQGRRSFAAGELGREGVWWFFPYAFAIKTPLPTLVVLALAAGVLGAAIVRRRRGPHEHVTWDLAPPAILAGVYWTAAMSVDLNIGHRHLLPSYPALFVLAGAAVHLRLAPARIARFVVPGLVAALAVVSFGIRPHYLAYFNALTGGPRHGYRALVDSSLDWGQDLPGLRDRLAVRRAGPPIYLSYFGTASPHYYGIAVRPLPGWPERKPREPAALEPGTYCISATMVQPVYGRGWGPWSEEYEREYRQLRQDLGDDLPAAEREARWRALEAAERTAFRNAWYQYEWLRFRRLTARLREREPDELVGYSILIYEVGADELRRALDGT